MDNVSMMDRASWRLFELITSEIDNLIIVMCIQSQSIDIHGDVKSSQGYNFKISDHAYNFYQERLKEYESQIFNVVETEPITSFDLRQILIDMAETYEKDMKDEIFLMTQIIDSNNSVKSYHGQLEIKNKMVKKYQVYDFFKEVEKEVITEVVKKCNGNPLLCISLVYQLLTNDFINIREQILLSTNKLRYFFKTNCWNNIELPPYSLKQNCCFIENAFLAKGSYSKISSEMAVSAYQLLKAASVFGDRFSMHQVREIFIFDDQNNYHLDILFKLLENRNLIELVYEENDSGDKIYRFNHTFLRECLFQLQIYEGQRKQLHSIISQFLQENMIYNWQTDWNFDKEQTILLQNLMAEEGVQNERQLSLKARQALVIKKVNACILSNQGVIKKGPLILESQITKKNQYQRFVQLTSKQLCWYKDKKDCQKGLEIGNVSLDQILKVTVLKNQFQIQADKNKQLNMTNISMDQTNMSMMNTSIIDTNKKANLLTFQIHCNEWNKKGVITKGSKTFSFIAGSRRDGEEWIAYIEYLRTKANFDQFVNKFGKVKFPIQQFEITQELNKHKITQKPEYKFGSELTKSVYTSTIKRSASNNHMASQQQLSSFNTHSQRHLKRKNLRRNIDLINGNQNDQNQKEVTQNLKTQISALFNIVSLQFMEHMQLNACKYKQETEQEECSNLNVVNHKETIKEQIIDKIAHLTREDEDGSIQNLHQVITDDMLDEIKREYQENQMFNIQDDGEQHNQQTAHLNNDLINLNQQNQAQNNDVLSAARRVTIFNPNIIDQGVANLRRIGSKMQFGFHRLSTIKRKSNNNDNVSQIENLIGTQQQNEQIDETMSFDDSCTLEEVKEELYDESQPYREVKIALPLKQFPFYEGIQVVQYISIKNDVITDNRQSKLQRRKKERVVGQDNGIRTSQIDHKENDNPTSIMKLQQQDKNNPQKHKKAQLMTKILEQTQKSQQFKAREEYRQLQIQALQQLQEEQKMSKQRAKEQRLKQKYSDQRKNEKQKQIKDNYESRMLSPNILIEQLESLYDNQESKTLTRAQNSIAYLQAMVDIDQSPIKKKSRNKQSNFAKESKKINHQTKVFKPTPSERQLNWIERDESVRKINAYREQEDNYSDQSESEDFQQYQNERQDYNKRERIYSDNYNLKSQLKDDSCNVDESIDNVNNYQNKSKFSQQLLSDRSPGTRSRKSLSPNRQAMTNNYTEARIIRNGVQYMAQDQRLQTVISQVKLNKNDIVKVTKEISDLNLVLCIINIEYQEIQVFLPRDQIEYINNYSQSPPQIRNKPPQSVYSHDNKSQFSQRISPNQISDKINSNSASTQERNLKLSQNNQLNAFELQSQQHQQQFYQTSTFPNQLNQLGINYQHYQSRNDKINKAHTDVQNSRRQLQTPLEQLMSNYDTFSSPLKDQELLSMTNDLNLADKLTKLNSYNHQTDELRIKSQLLVNQTSLQQNQPIDRIQTINNNNSQQADYNIQRFEISQFANNQKQNNNLIVQEITTNQNNNQTIPNQNNLQQQNLGLTLKLQERKKKKLEQQVAEQVLQKALQDQFKESVSNSATGNLKMLERRKKKQMDTAQSTVKRQDETPQKNIEID